MIMIRTKRSALAKDFPIRVGSFSVKNGLRPQCALGEGFRGKTGSQPRSGEVLPKRLNRASIIARTYAPTARAHFGHFSPKLGVSIDQYEVPRSYICHQWRGSGEKLEVVRRMPVCPFSRMRTFTRGKRVIEHKSTTTLLIGDRRFQLPILMNCSRRSYHAVSLLLE